LTSKVPTDDGLSSAITSTQQRLEAELDRVKTTLGINEDLDVLWVPDVRNKLAGEVKGAHIMIYQTRPDEAVATLRHEVVDWYVTRVAEPYQQIANALMSLLNERAYITKERVVDRLVKVLLESLDEGSGR
jgi:hypothetical protein